MKFYIHPFKKDFKTSVVYFIKELLRQPAQSTWSREYGHTYMLSISRNNCDLFISNNLSWEWLSFISLKHSISIEMQALCWKGKDEWELSLLLKNFIFCRENVANIPNVTVSMNDIWHRLYSCVSYQNFGYAMTSISFITVYQSFPNIELAHHCMLEKEGYISV